MEIVRKEPTTKPIHRVSYGEVFLFSGEVFVKIRPAMSAGVGVTHAIRMSDGDEMLFVNPEMTVEPLEGAFVVGYRDGSMEL